MSKTPIQLITDERHRQVSSEGWSLEHDDQHTDGSLAMAAALYAARNDNLMHVNMCGECNTPHVTDPWPWWNRDPNPGHGARRARAWDKREEHSRVKRLIIAGALIVAELERMERANPGGYCDDLQAVYNGRQDNKRFTHTGVPHGTN